MAKDGKLKRLLASPVVVIGLSLCAVAGLSLFYGRGVPGDWTEPAKRKAAVEVAWHVRDGSTWKLSEHAGEVVLLNYFATWCPPCVREMPDIVEVTERLKSRGVSALAVSMDEGNDKGVAAFIERYRIQFPVAMGAGDIRTSAIQAIPVTALFDKSGRLAVMFEGGVTAGELERALARLLKE